MFLRNHQPRNNILCLIYIFLLLFSCRQNQPNHLGEAVNSKADSLNRLADFWEKTNIDSALFYAREAQLIAEKLLDTQSLIKSYNNLGFTLFEKGQSAEAYRMHSQALQLSKATHDTVNLSKTLNFIGRYYNQLGDYDNGLKYYLDSYEWRQILQDTVGMAVTSNNIGLCYYRLQNYDLSEKYLLKAIELDSMLGDELYLVGDYNNLGLTYKATNKISQALKAHQHSLELAQKTEDTDGISTALGNLAMDYIEINEFTKAEDLLNKSMVIRRNLKKPAKLIWGHIMWGEFYLAKDQYGLALHHADSANALNKQLNNIDLQKKILEIKAKSLQNQKIFDKAFKTQLILDSLENITHQENRLKSIAASEARLNLLEKEAELNTEKARFELLEIKHQITIQWMIFGGLGLMLTFTAIYLYRSRTFERRRLQL